MTPTPPELPKCTHCGSDEMVPQTAGSYCQYMCLKCGQRGPVLPLPELPETIWAYEIKREYRMCEHRWTEQETSIHDENGYIGATYHHDSTVQFLKRELEEMRAAVRELAKDLGDARHMADLNGDPVEELQFINTLEKHAATIKKAGG